MKNLRRWLTILNLHLAGAAALAVLVLVLAIKAALAIHAAGAVNSESYQEQQIRYAQLHAELAQVQGLPQKVDGRAMKHAFYQTRIAPNYSTILGTGCDRGEKSGSAFKHPVLTFTCHRWPNGSSH